MLVGRILLIINIYLFYLYSFLSSYPFPYFLSLLFFPSFLLVTTPSLTGRVRGGSSREGLQGLGLQGRVYGLY